MIEVAGTRSPAIETITTGSTNDAMPPQGDRPSARSRNMTGSLNQSWVFAIRASILWNDSPRITSDPGACRRRLTVAIVSIVIGLLEARSRFGGEARRDGMLVHSRRGLKPVLAQLTARGIRSLEHGSLKERRWDARVGRPTWPASQGKLVVGRAEPPKT